MIEKFDVVIVGGGMVGSAVACSLGNSTLKVAVIESTTPQPFSPEQSHDLRVSALSIASKNILATVGAWDGHHQTGGLFVDHAFKRFHVHPAVFVGGHRNCLIAGCRR